VEDINRVILTGTLVGDSVFAYTAGGTAVATFTLAFSSDSDKQGNTKRKKGLIDIIFFGAEACRWPEALKKGKQIVVEGRLQQRSWRTPEGIHKSKTEIIANRIECCGSYKGKREVNDIK